MIAFEFKKLRKSRLIYLLLGSLIILFAIRIFLFYKGKPDTSARERMKEFKEAEALDENTLKKEINTNAEKAFSPDSDSLSYRRRYLACSYVLNSMEYKQGFQDTMRDYVTSLVIRREDSKRENRNYSLYDKMIKYYNVKKNIEIVNNNDIENYLHTFTMYDYNIFFDVMLLIICTVLYAFVFHAEDIYNSRELSVSSLMGRRKLYLSKMFTLVLSLLIIIGVTCALIFAGGVFRGIYKWNASMQSLKVFQYCPFSISLWQYIVITCLLKFFVALVFIGILRLFDWGSRNAVRSLTIGILISILCFIVSSPYLNHTNDGYETIKKVDKIRSLCPFGLFMPQYYFDDFDCVVVKGIPFFRLTTAMLVGFIIIIAGFLSGFTDRNARK